MSLKKALLCVFNSKLHLYFFFFIPKNDDRLELVYFPYFLKCSGMVVRETYDIELLKSTKVYGTYTKRKQRVV